MQRLQQRLFDLYFIKNEIALRGIRAIMWLVTALVILVILAELLGACKPYQLAESNFHPFPEELSYGYHYS
jgi:hypothetical protein